MPDVHPVTGEWCAGIGRGLVSRERGGVIALDAGDAYWLGDDPAYQREVGTRAFLETAGRVLDPRGANRFRAGGNVWAAFLDDGSGYRDSHGNTNPRWNVASVGPDGTIAVILDRSTGIGLQLLAPNGEITAEILDAAPDGQNVQVLSRSQVVWTEQGHQIIRTVGLPPFEFASYVGFWLTVIQIDGAWWLLYQDERDRLLFHRAGETRGKLITQGAAYRPGVSRDGRVVYATRAGELPEDIVPVDALALPDVDLRYRAPIPPIGRPCFLGFFEFTTPSVPLPGNCSLPVSTLRVMVAGEAVAQYVAAEAAGTIEALDAAVEEARAGGLPVLAYWPRPLQGGRVPDCDWIGVEAYCLAAETPEGFEARIGALLARLPADVPIALIAQCYTSNASLTTDLAGLVPVYARLARGDQRILAILAFSGSGRATGLQDHPDVLPLWIELAQGIPSAPVMAPRPPTPPTPPPAPPAGYEDPEMPQLFNEAEFNAYMDAVADIVVPMLGISRVDARQGAREMADRFFKHGQNPRIADGLWGIIARSGTRPLDAAKDLDPLMEKVITAQEGLRR